MKEKWHAMCCSTNRLTLGERERQLTRTARTLRERWCDEPFSFSERGITNIAETWRPVHRGPWRDVGTPDAIKAGGRARAGGVLGETLLAATRPLPFHPPNNSTKFFTSFTPSFSIRSFTLRAASLGLMWPLVCAVGV
jgi:hypothetical protein